MKNRPNRFALFGRLYLYSGSLFRVLFMKFRYYFIYGIYLCFRKGRYIYCLALGNAK